MIFDESKLLDILSTSLSGVEKIASYDLSQAVNPAGTLAVSVSGIDNANQGLPDYFVYVTVMGQMLVECDPDKSLIRQLYADTLASVQRWTPASVTAALEWDSPAAVVGIINIRSAVQMDGATRIFRIDLTLATTDVFLEYYEHPLPVYQCEDTGTGIQYIRFMDENPCAVQRITVVNTIAPDGGRRSTFTREVAYGDWNNRENLTYYPVNTPVPVQTES
jgi:hypothetical protein